MHHPEVVSQDPAVPAGAFPVIHFTFTVLDTHALTFDPQPHERLWFDDDQGLWVLQLREPWEVAALRLPPGMSPSDACKATWTCVKDPSGGHVLLISRGEDVDEKDFELGLCTGEGTKPVAATTVRVTDRGRGD